mmetsp:Transcript_23005/g.35557  ORF Transcript_23005/g.35557 Transcript_23005/m.35557 type:complete len:94 (-) Transcript_23005:1766-2047(-)
MRKNDPSFWFLKPDLYCPRSRTHFKLDQLINSDFSWNCCLYLNLCNFGIFRYKRFFWFFRLNRSLKDLDEEEVSQVCDFYDLVVSTIINDYVG